MAGQTNFPTSLDSHTGADPFGFGEIGNGEYTALTADASTSATTFSVGTTAAFASRGLLICEDEVFSYTGKNSTSFTGVTRGVDGTTVAAHKSGRIVGSAPIAANHNDLAAAIVAVETVLGAGINSSYGVHRKIASATISSTGVAQIDFTAIPAVYRSLEIVFTGRSDAATTAVNMAARFAASSTNFDTSTSYDWAGMNGTGLSVASVEAIGDSSVNIGSISAASAPANAAGSVSVLIPDYAGTTFHKTTIARAARKDSNASGNLRSANVGGHWRSTSAIVAIRIYPASGNFEVGSQATLYGLSQ